MSKRLKFYCDRTVSFIPPSEEAERRARAIVRATTHHHDPKVLLEMSEDVPSAMKGLAIAALS